MISPTTVVQADVPVDSAKDPARPARKDVHSSMLSSRGDPYYVAGSFLTVQCITLPACRRQNANGLLNYGQCLRILKVIG